MGERGSLLRRVLRKTKLLQRLHYSFVEQPTRARKDQAGDRTSRLHRQEHVIVDRERREHAGHLELEADAGACPLCWRIHGNVARTEVDSPLSRCLRASYAFQ